MISEAPRASPPSAVELLRRTGARGILAKASEADLVAIARPTLCDPYWPRKTVEGRELEILRCVYCNKCKEADEAFQKVYCAQWEKKGTGFRLPPE